MHQKLSFIFDINNSYVVNFLDNFCLFVQSLESFYFFTFFFFAHTKFNYKWGIMYFWILEEASSRFEKYAKNINFKTHYDILVCLLI